MNEKAIVKRMKAAAKAAGCKIWRNEHDVLVLCGGGWCFVCEWGNKTGIFLSKYICKSILQKEMNPI